mgnify:CR=1 FL=1
MAHGGCKIAKIDDHSSFSGRSGRNSRHWTIHYSKSEKETQIFIRKAVWIQKESTEFVKMGANGEHMELHGFGGFAGRFDAHVRGFGVNGF